MRPLPRLHAVTDARILDLPDFGVRAAAIAAAGPAVALHARDRGAPGARLAEAARRILSLARPPEAAVLVNGHPELARALGAQGVQLGRGDLSPADARTVMGSGWIGCSVHSEVEAEEAALAGADFLLAGTIFQTASHPDVKPAGPELVRSCSRTGVPVIAIGGITAANIGQVLQAGAWGVATISAAWLARDPAEAVVEMLERVRGEK
ncbi:MAG: thiamine phosphate synthase [Gemmatimonadales bacterium]